MACNAVADVNFSNNFPRLTDPVTLIPASRLNGIFNGALVLNSVLLVAAAGSILFRLRRSEGDRRLQLEWVVYATAVASVAIFVATLALPIPERPWSLCSSDHQPASPSSDTGSTTSTSLSTRPWYSEPSPRSSPRCTSRPSPASEPSSGGGRSPTSVSPSSPRQ